MTLQEFLGSANHMITLEYESEPDLLKKKVKDFGLEKFEILCRQRLQVNPVRHYRRLKARSMNIRPSEVQIQARPGWTHISEGIFKTENGDVLFQAAPVRRLSRVYFVNGEKASPEMERKIESCLRKKNDNNLVQLRSFRLDRILRATTDHQTVS